MRVLLVEEEPDVIAAVSLFFSEVKDCRLEVCTSGEEALLKVPSLHPHLVMLAHGLLGKDSRVVASEIHRNDSSVYIIATIPERNQEILQDYMISGASDCVPKDRNYIPSLVQSVKKALTRLSKRTDLKLPPMARAEQVAIDENLPDIVLNLDRQGRILYANRAITDVLGHEQKDVIHRPLQELIQGDQNRLVFEEFLQNIEYEATFHKRLPLIKHTGEDEEYEIQFSWKNGEWIYGVARRIKTKGAIRETEIQAALQTPEEYVPQRIGPYRVMTLLGAGSWGRVYKGFDEQLERFVAIKVAGHSRAEEKDLLERFHREAKLLASITHPNIALIYYLGSLEGLPYFCMEYLPGGSLEDLLREQKVIDPDVAVSYTMQVALGLDKALEKGVVHLDVKPSNLMLAEHGRIKVVDFGLARTSQELQVGASKMVGTPLYIAPEQIRGGMMDHRCDIYSLGLTFFRMLYGFIPHAGGRMKEVFQRRLNEELPPVQSLDSPVSASLYRILEQMVRNDPSKRYQTYSDLISDLEKVRRRAVEEVSGPLTAVPGSSKVQLRGLLYDRPFAEILGDVVSRKQSGKLTFSWIDLQKVLHFRDGNIIAVLSNQEGERFLDLLLQHQTVSGKDARRLFSSSSNLFLSYSSAMAEISKDAKEKFAQDLKNLSHQILQGLFSWMVGEYMFEEGEFPSQGDLKIRGDEVLQKGIKEWIDIPSIRRRIYGEDFLIRLQPDFQKRLKEILLAPADAFLLFRFENQIRFRDLQDLSGLSDQEFLRLIYLFWSLGIIDVNQEEAARKANGEQVKAREAPAAIPVVVSPAVEEKEPFAEPPPVAKPAETKRPVLSGSRRFQKKSALDDRSLGFYYYECAVKSYAAKNYWAAVEYCKKALEKQKEARIYRLMGNALATHPAFRHEAMDAYKQALDITPGNLLVTRDMADLFFVTENYALAKSKYREVLSKKPDDQHCLEKLKEIEKTRKKK